MKHLVIIGLVFPEPSSTAAGHRMMQLIQLFQEENYRITFLSSSNITEHSHSFNNTIELKNIRLNDNSFDELIKSLNPDIVLFDRYITEEQYGWRISEQCPKAIKILDTEDLHFLRTARKIAFQEQRNVNFKDYINDVFKREIASVFRCDLSLIISRFEMSLLIETFKINSEILFYIPFLSENFSKKSSNFDDRQHFVSIGNFLHEPNWQTVIKLKQIWKSIRKKLPESEIHIYGAYTSEKVWQLHDENSGFIIKGRAKSVEKIFNNYRVLLAPIPFGAGLKGKLWESMIYGIPNVTSEIGAEAMHHNDIWNGYIENNEEKFIEKSVELYQNPNLWQKAQENGYQLLKQLFNKTDFDENFKIRIAEIEKNLETHRNHNFLGQILQYHFLQSTKYLSKWIEEKNKKDNL